MIYFGCDYYPEQWKQWLEEGEARFRRAGEVSGLAFARDGAGRLVSLARNGCCGVSVTFHTLGPDGALREAFSVERVTDELGRGPCEGQAIGEPPPAASVRAVCALPPGRIPGTRLAVP